MSKITRADINASAHLARIAVNEEEIEALTKEISRVLDLIDQLDKIDTADVAPMAHPLELIQPLRDDKVTEVDQRDHFQKNAPQAEAGLYLVPKVIDEAV